MTISKLTPFLCVLAFGAMSLSAGAADSSSPAVAPANQLSSTNSVSGSKAKAKAASPKEKAAVVPPLVMVTVTNMAGNGPGRMQIVAPALPIGAAKAERLKALLTKYQTDQITPSEYHQQRAAILAEP